MFDGDYKLSFKNNTFKDHLLKSLNYKQLYLNVYMLKQRMLKINHLLDKSKSINKKQWR